LSFLLRLAGFSRGLWREIVRPGIEVVMEVDGTVLPCVIDGSTPTIAHSNAQVPGQRARMQDPVVDKEQLGILTLQLDPLLQVLDRVQEIVASASQITGGLGPLARRLGGAVTIERLLEVVELGFDDSSA